MLPSVPLVPKALDEYRATVGDDRIDEILQLAAPLRGARVLHINATSFGGGVAEILNTLVPLMHDIGLAADWQVIRASDELYQVTKAMHNSLQGMFVQWTPQMQDLWLHYNRLNAELFDETYDFIVVHDPQPAAILSWLHESRPAHTAGRWIWRCHIDLTDAQPQTWELVNRYLSHYHGAIFTAQEYIKADLNGPRPFIVPPAIDPLSPKNVDLPAETSRAILDRYGIDHQRPFIAQISRFDPWKNPLGAIEVYRELKQRFPALQLVLVASMAHDDPEGWSWYERTVRRAGEDYDIHILSNLNGVGNVEVNAFQRADVVIQRSLREGFGLVVSEALWKERPVVADAVGGIPLQLVDGESGFLVHSPEEWVDRISLLLGDRQLATRMGAAGRSFVRDRFLITRYLRDYLQIFHTLNGTGAPSLPDARAARSDGGS